MRAENLPISQKGFPWMYINQNLIFHMQQKIEKTAADKRKKSLINLEVGRAQES